MKEKEYNNKAEKSHLENIQEQEESEIEMSRHLAINQEKQTPPHVYQQHHENDCIDIYNEIDPLNQIHQENIEIEKKNDDQFIHQEEEIIFINVYPEKKIEQENSYYKEERTKKSGIHNISHKKTETSTDNNKSNLNEENYEIKDEDVVKNNETLISHKTKNPVPQPIFLSNLSEVKHITQQEEENLKFRYSKMDEKTAEMLYKER